MLLDARIRKNWPPHPVLTWQRRPTLLSSRAVDSSVPNEESAVINS
jgi:hypothetical protein